MQAPRLDTFTAAQCLELAFDGELTLAQCFALAVVVTPLLGTDDPVRQMELIDHLTNPTHYDS